MVCRIPSEDLLVQMVLWYESSGLINIWNCSVHCVNYKKLRTFACWHLRDPWFINACIFLCDLYLKLKTVTLCCIFLHHNWYFIIIIYISLYIDSWIYSKVVKNLSALLSDANQSQGGDMKRKSHWPITARWHNTASWTHPPIGIFTLIDWHSDVV